MTELWALAANEDVYLVIKIDSTSSYIPLFRSEEAARKFIASEGGLEPRKFAFGPYDYLCDLKKGRGYTFYLRIIESEEQ